MWSIRDRFRDNELRGSAASAHLDMMRGLAALAVLAFHLRTLFFVDYQDVHPIHQTAITRALYWASSFGTQAVMVFFVLSGFLISASVLRAWSEQRWSWRVYLIDRTSRLYTVLIPALLLGLLWDRLGIALLPHHSIYYAKHAYMHVPFMDFSVVGSSRITVLLANALFLQTIIVSPFGSNSPLWSLSFEFWYYIVFALGFSAIISDTKHGRKLACAIAAPLLLLGVGPYIAAWFLIWLIGAAINLVPPLPALRGRILMHAGVLFLFATLRIISGSAFFIKWGYLADALVGVATALLIIIALQRRSVRKSNLYSRVASRLAGFSYTLYLVHFPCLFFLDALIIDGARWQPQPWSFAAALLLGAAVILYASVVADLTERRTADVRRLLFRWVAKGLARWVPADEVQTQSARL